MNKMKMFAVIGVLAIAVGALTFTKQAYTDAKPGTSQAQSPAAQSSQPDIPDYVVYRHLFRHVAALKEKADELEHQGKDAAHLRNFFKHKANLSSEQSDILVRIAARCALDIKALDERAKPIIEAYKAQYPNGQVPHGQKPLPPPAELHEMTAERNDLVLRSRDELRAAFGEEGFKRFNEFVRSKVAPNVTPGPAGQ